MPITAMQDDTQFVIRLEGEIGLGEAVELKQRLLEWLLSGRRLLLSMERVAEIDVTVLQLLQSATEETDRGGAGIKLHLSEAVGRIFRAAGFEALVEAAAGRAGA